MARYLIGIDLGTTNSALAYVDLQHPRRSETPNIQSFAVPQLTAAGEIKERPLLPSFLYLPGQHDLPVGATALPWDAQRSYAVGEFARNHGGKVPGRLVSSAKSWLCHDGVDRSAGLMPWTAPPDVPRISPIEASARYLRHIVESWNCTMAEDRPDPVGGEEREVSPGAFAFGYQHRAAINPFIVRQDERTGRRPVPSDRLVAWPMELRGHGSPGCCCGYPARSCSGSTPCSSRRCCSSFRPGSAGMNLSAAHRHLR